MLLETGDTISYNGNKRFPMQSVYKLPIAMAVFAKVDRDKLSLKKQHKIETSDYIAKAGYSPLRDKFPNGIQLSLEELLYFNIESDGTACDVLLKLLGGTKNAERYIHQLGVKDIAIATTEMIQVANDTIQYQNWTTPKAMTQLLKAFYSDNVLSSESKALLVKFMAESQPGKNRLKGLLPKGVVVAHKTGTAGTSHNGLTRATNDVGVITLPNGQHLAISVFISDSYASERDRELTIAKISKTIFDYRTSSK